MIGARRVELSATRTAVIDARRRPRAGEILWTVRLREDVAPDAPELSSQIDNALDRLRDEFGLNRKGVREEIDVVIDEPSR